jgi:hypothetical protein
MAETALENLKSSRDPQKRWLRIYRTVALYGLGDNDSAITEIGALDFSVHSVGWPHPIERYLGRFYPESDLIEATNGNRDRLVEAKTVIGCMALIRGNNAKAGMELAWARSQNATNLIEHSLASFILISKPLLTRDVHSTATEPITRYLPQTFRVTGIPLLDHLKVRSGPGANNMECGRLPRNAKGIIATGEAVTNGDTRWLPIQCGRLTGWVSELYLTPETPQR